MDVKGPIRLALEAQSRFEEAAVANKQLLMVSEAQEQVMGELLQSMPSAEETAKEIAAVEAACAKLDQQIKTGSQQLLESLWTLWQRVELPGIHTRGNNEVACALWS